MNRVTFVTDWSLITRVSEQLCALLLHTDFQCNYPHLYLIHSSRTGDKMVSSTVNHVMSIIDCFVITQAGDQPFILLLQWFLILPSSFIFDSFITDWRLYSVFKIVNRVTFVTDWAAITRVGLDHRRSCYKSTLWQSSTILSCLEYTSYQLCLHYRAAKRTGQHVIADSFTRWYLSFTKRFQ